MLPIWRMCHRRPKGRRICKSGRTNHLSKANCIPTTAVGLIATWPDCAAAQDPLAIPSAAASQLAVLSLASLPYAAAASILAVVFLVVFNQKLQREVRERKRAENRLRFAEREKAAVLDSMTEGVVYLDPNQRLIWANRTVRGTKRASPDFFTDQRCYQIWAGRQKPCEGCPLSRTLKEGTTQTSEVTDDQGRCWQVQAYTVPAKDGGISGVVVTHRDVTENRHLQEEILKSRKLESVGVLAGGIAHDFNNMLTAVMGYISLAKLKQPGEGGSHPYLDKAMEASDRARQLASRLLTFSQGGHPIRHRVAVKPLLARAGDSAAKNHPVKIRVEVTPECHTLWCDKAQILQAVGNVLDNACENTPARGEILIRAECKQIEEGIDELIPPGGYLRVSVCDRGAGIPKEMADKICDPYFTTKPMGAEKGSGLGLAITHSILHKHQGHITVEERPGGGTSVHLFLPLDCGDAVEQPIAPSPDPAEPIRQGGRILVLEDETLVWGVAEMLLSHLGYQATHASHGEAAVDLYKAAQAAGEPFGTVILDLTIKGGMGGRETLEALKRIDPGVHAFVSSGYSSDPVLTDYTSYGFSGVIAKPYTLDEVRRALADTAEPPPR